MSQKYVAGNLIEDTATFTADDNTTPVDPSFVVVTYQITFAGAISGPYRIQYASATTPAAGVIAKLSTGTYEVQMDTSLLPGYWVYQWAGSGNGQALLPVAATVYPAPI